MKKAWLHFIFMVDINKKRVKLSYGKCNQKLSCFLYQLQIMLEAVSIRRLSGAVS